MTRRAWLLWGCALCLAACADGGLRDAGAGPDATTVDAGGTMDASIIDGGSTDAGFDAGPFDAAFGDGGADADVSDAGTDAGPSDGGDAGALGPTPRAGDLVIVEIQGNPQGATDPEGEYVELLNVSGRTLDLVGVALTHVDWAGGEPVASLGTHTIGASVVVGPGERALLTRSSGGFFGGASRDHVYDGFLFSNGDVRFNRLRLMVPSWGGDEPPAAADLIDEVRTGVAAFDNIVRGRALTLDPDVVPTAESNDAPTSWCQAAAVDGLAYRTNNWGTPGAVNRCL